MRKNIKIDSTKKTNQNIELKKEYLEHLRDHWSNMLKDTTTENKKRMK